MGQPDQLLLTATEMVWKGVLGRNVQSFDSGLSAPTLQNIYKRCISRAGNVALSEHVTHYGWVGFPYYNMTTPNREGSPYLPPGKALIISLGLSPGSLHQCIGPQTGYFQILVFRTKRDRKKTSNKFLIVIKLCQYTFCTYYTISRFTTYK